MSVSKAELSKHKILEFLWDKWVITKLKVGNSENAAFTISEIATALSIDLDLVDEQVTTLYLSHEVNAVSRNSEPKFFITEKGFASVASQAIPKERKSAGVLLQNKNTTTVPQMLTGVLTFINLALNFTSTVSLRKEK
jgi:hypothetical protein